MSDKIRLTANILLGLGILAALIILIAMMGTSAGLGCGVAAGMVATVWMTYILLMGYAEIIDNTAEQAKCSKEILNALNRANAAVPPAKPAAFSVTKHDGKAAPATLPRTDAVLALEREDRDASYGDKVIECPACGMIQKKNRSVCWKCGVKFVHQEQ